MVGILNQLLRTVRLSGQTWCCESCERAALAGRQGAVHYKPEPKEPASDPAAGRHRAATHNKP